MHTGSLISAFHWILHAMRNNVGTPEVVSVNDNQEVEEAIMVEEKQKQSKMCLVFTQSKANSSIVISVAVWFQMVNKEIWFYSLFIPGECSHIKSK